MKNFKIFVTVLLFSVFAFTGCEENNAESENQSKDQVSDVDNDKRSDEFDFSEVEKIENKELLEIEKGFLESAQKVSLVEELQNTEIDDKAPELSLVNDYLKYQGKEKINLDEYYYTTEKIIRNPEANAVDMAESLQKFNIYSDEQLRLFIDLDKYMSNAESIKEVFNTLDNFKEKVLSNEKLNTFERNTLLLYAMSMKGLMLTDYNTQKSLGACIRCVWKNKWRILGWGVFRSLPKVVGCIFSNFRNFSNMIYCMIRSLGSSIAWTFNRYCGSVC